MSGAASPASPLSIGSLTQLALSLAAIVALILALSWLLKRLRMTPAGGRGALCVIDQVAVGPRERIVLVQAGDSQLLVGVGANGVTDLKPLAAPVVAGERAGARAPALDPAAFAARLREFMKREGGP